MSNARPHSHVQTLEEQLRAGRISRREFLRTATLLGLSAPAAYFAVARITGEQAIPETWANRSKGGTIRVGARVQDVSTPHSLSWGEASEAVRPVCEYLTRTGADNVTRPFLISNWTVTEDLRTWTLPIRRDVTWRKGGPLTADQVIWNLKHVLDPATGSSVLGLMKPYLMEEVETGEVDESGEKVTRVELWDANAIEKVDDFTVRLNLKTPQLAIPEHLFHYPLAILDPAENGQYGVGANGTGAFNLVEYEIGVKAVFEARDDFWGEGPHLDRIELIDLGDDPSAAVAALASKQVDGLYEISGPQISALEEQDHVRIYTATTAQTAVARGKVDQAPFDDPRVRKALRLAIDQRQVVNSGIQGRGTPGEHHHVAPIHPEYAELPFFQRDIPKAKQLLADAGYPDGLDLEIAVRDQPSWLKDSLQVMVQNWLDANIRVTINLMPSSAYWDVWTKVPFGYTDWGGRPLGVMVLGLAYRCGVPWNESGYCNPEFDRLLTKAEGTLDVAARREIMAELETIMQEDGPVVQAFWLNVSTAYDKKVEGFALTQNKHIFWEQLAIRA